MIAVQAINLTKIYHWYPTRAHLVKEMLCLNKRTYHEQRLAIDDVSFKVEAGESVGLIGQNGAGKTTLLKMVAGLSLPTQGTCEVNGKVSALFDLGTGFHPDYSGFQNVRINGMLMGLTRREVERKLPAIVEFAELKEAIHLPLRTYSSGMQARLAFAIATVLEPDILLVDEVLAVGDAYFVNKCIQYLQRFIATGGTALIVSHNSFLLGRLCHKILWLENGKLREFDSAQAVCRTYDQYVRRLESIRHGQTGGNIEEQRWGSGEIRISSVCLLDHEERPERIYFRGERMVIRLEYEAAGCFENPSVFVLITRQDGTLATSCFSGEDGTHLGWFQGAGFVKIVFDPLLLGDGAYWLSVGVFPNRQGPESIYRMDPFDYQDFACEFTVKRPSRPLQTVFDHPVIWIHRDTDGSPIGSDPGRKANRGTMETS